MGHRETSGAPDPLETALAWAEAGHGVALATVISTWGSAPRPVGSQLVIRTDERFEGSVSGGCVEGAVIVDALDVIASGDTQERSFGVADAKAWEVGLACGGRISVYLEPVSGPQAPPAALDMLRALIDARSARQAVVRMTDLDGGDTALFQTQEQDVAGQISRRFNVAFPDEALTDALRLDRSGLVETGGRRLFMHVFNPPLRLFVIGAVHIAQALVPMAQGLGYDVAVIDPRGAFATSARFGSVRLIEEWPDTALVAEHLDERSAVVTLTHDPKLDDAALKEALGSKAFYIGSLGSRKTHKARLDRLFSLGFPQHTLLRIYGPVGFAIGARSPAEIALSIMAQITQVLRQGAIKPDSAA
ncbi:XdhC/CoxI family protein [Iodidimonas muriae]|uniref:XdhC/CoxI family protein n=1 Tax=Iodidimonas muriae TaxID=261467 RepID=A0ABQ2LG55_9PROT|nr:XdhC family protein [Iodidimonas muriae]GER08543.1 XdhC/CoxI family protein [Kordiimonadales bacterium JCM 17843]GGO16628.1 XdhC/CoxI family protein [Iodidimonas muriae]